MELHMLDISVSQKNISFSTFNCTWVKGDEIKLLKDVILLNDSEDI